MIGRVLIDPRTFVAALVLLGIVLGVSCWPRVQPATVEPTPTAAPVITIIPAPATATPRDVFLVPPTPHPEVIIERTPLPTATVTPTVTPTLIPPPATVTPAQPAIQRGDAMPNLPQYEEIERAFKAPAEVLAKLPPSGLRERAEQLVEQSYRYAKEIREKSGPRDAEPAPADAAVTLRDGLFWTACYRLEHLHVHQGGACSVAG